MMPQRTRPLAWSQLLPLDIALAMSVIVVVTAMFAGEVHNMVFKARLVGAQWSFSTYRTASMEDYASTGALVAPTGKPSALNSSPQSGPYRQRLAFLLDGSSIVATGPLVNGLGHATGREIEISFNPASVSDPLPWSVMWTCGARSAPQGWLMVAKPKAATLAVDETPAICREPMKSAS